MTVRISLDTLRNEIHIYSLTYEHYETIGAPLPRYRITRAIRPRPQRNISTVIQASR